MDFIHNTQEGRPLPITFFLLYLFYFNINNTNYTILREWIFIPTLLVLFVSFSFMIIDIINEKNNNLQKYRYNSTLKKINYQKMFKGFYLTVYNGLLVNYNSRLIIFYPLMLKYNDNIENYSYLSIIYSIIKTLLFSDIIFYTTHRLLHTKYLYKKIHNIHHQYIDTYACIFNSCHTIEAFIVNEMSVMLPPILSNLPKELFFYWIIIGMLSSIISHTGYNFLGVNHNNHHKYFNYEYGLSTLPIYMDYIFNTKYKLK